jgi:hypothetical protein
MGGLGRFLRNQSTEAVIVGLQERRGRLAGALLDVFDGANCLPSAEAGGGGILRKTVQKRHETAVTRDKRCSGGSFVVCSGCCCCCC